MTVFEMRYVLLFYHITYYLVIVNI